jgi:hypothetical protein
MAYIIAPRPRLLREKPNAICQYCEGPYDDADSDADTTGFCSLACELDAAHPKLNEHRVKHHREAANDQDANAFVGPNPRRNEVDECPDDVVNGVDLDHVLAPGTHHKESGWPGDHSQAHDPSMSKANKSFESASNLDIIVDPKAQQGARPVRERALGFSFAQFKEAWERSDKCAQCRAKLTFNEKFRGTICDKCVKTNKSRVYDMGNERADDELDEQASNAMVAWAHEKTYYMPGPYEEGFWSAVDNMNAKSLTGFDAKERTSFFAGRRAACRQYAQSKASIKEATFYGKGGAFTNATKKALKNYGKKFDATQKAMAAHTNKQGGGLLVCPKCQTTTDDPTYENGKPKCDECGYIRESNEYADNQTQTRNPKVDATFDLKKNATVARSESADTATAIPSNNNGGGGGSVPSHKTKKATAEGMKGFGPIAFEAFTRLREGYPEDNFGKQGTTRSVPAHELAVGQELNDGSSIDAKVKGKPGVFWIITKNGSRAKRDLNGPAVLVKEADEHYFVWSYVSHDGKYKGGLHRIGRGLNAPVELIITNKDGRVELQQTYASEKQAKRVWDTAKRGDSCSRCGAPNTFEPGRQPRNIHQIKTTGGKTVNLCTTCLKALNESSLTPTCDRCGARNIYQGKNKAGKTTNLCATCWKADENDE